jgi:hypothetical protein
MSSNNINITNEPSRTRGSINLPGDPHDHNTVGVDAAAAAAAAAAPSPPDGDTAAVPAAYNEPANIYRRPTATAAAAARRIRTGFAARAQATAAALGINLGDSNDASDDGGGDGNTFDNICPITHEPASDPVTLGNSIRVYSRHQSSHGAVVASQFL